MTAPVLLRVSVPRWEPVARYAVCASGILLSIYAYHVEPEKERNPEHPTLWDLGPWVKCSAALAPRWGRGFGLLGSIFGKRWCIKPAKQCLWTYILYTTVITWHDSQRSCSSGPHDLLHRVRGGVFTWPTFCTLCLRSFASSASPHIILTTSPPHQLQTTGLLE